jgi:predicted alpha/beta hydrolase family esterase
VLLVPGLCGSGPSHWQTIWEQRYADCSKVELGRWENPHRNTWINNLNLAVHRAGRPVVLVAHSLGCLAVAWWARFEQRQWTQDGGASPVVGALMVAPPEVDFFPLDERVARFAPTPAERLPFPTRLVASRNDPWMGFHTAQALARRWGSTLVDAGEAGHVNADSQLGEWSFGREQLGLLLRDATPTTDPAPEGTRAQPDPVPAPSGERQVAHR